MLDLDFLCFGRELDIGDHVVCIALLIEQRVGSQHPAINDLVKSFLIDSLPIEREDLQT